MTETPILDRLLAVLGSVVMFVPIIIIGTLKGFVMGIYDAVEHINDCWTTTTLK